MADTAVATPPDEATMDAAASSYGKSSNQNPPTVQDYLSHGQEQFQQLPHTKEWAKPGFDKEAIQEGTIKPEHQAAYSKWYKDFILGDKNGSREGQDYNLPAYWNKYKSPGHTGTEELSQNESTPGTPHMKDEYKFPWEPAVSRESKYVDSKKAPYWEYKDKKTGKWTTESMEDGTYSEARTRNDKGQVFAHEHQDTGGIEHFTPETAPNVNEPSEAEMDAAAKNFGKLGTEHNPLSGVVKFFEEANKNPIVQGLDAFEGSALKGAARATTLPADAVAQMTGHQPVSLPGLESDKEMTLKDVIMGGKQPTELEKNIAAHPIAAGIGNFGGSAAAMMANPLYETEQLGKLAVTGLGKVIPGLAEAATKVPAMTKIAKAALGSIPISAEMAINQQAMDNKGKIDYAKAAQLAAGYVAANAGITGAGLLLGEAGKKVIGAIAQQMEKAEQTAPLKPAAFQQSQSGQPGGLVADILNQLGQASRRVQLGNKVIEFTDPQDAALFHAAKGIGNKKGRKAWQTLRNAGMTDAQITDQAKALKDGASLLVKDEKSPSVTIAQGAAQKRAEAEILAKQAEKEAKTQAKEQKQTNAAQDKRAKELTKQAEKEEKEAAKLAEKQKKEEQDAFAKEVDDAEKAIAKNEKEIEKAEAAAAKFKESGDKEDEKKALQELAKYKEEVKKQKALLDKANESWEKSKIKAADEKLVGETTKFSNREENWEYRHDAIPQFNKSDVPLGARPAFNKALTQIVSKGEARLQAETDYEATQDLFREAMGIGAKTDKDIYQLERERLKASIPDLQTEQGAAHFSVLPKTRPNLSLTVANDLKKLSNQMKAGKDVRNDIARLMIKQKKVLETAQTNYTNTVNKEGQKIAAHMPVGTQLDHGNANVWLNEGNTKVIAGDTPASQAAAAKFKSDSLKSKQNPNTSYVHKVQVETMEGHIKTSVQELKNTAAMSGNKDEIAKLDAIIKTLKGEAEGIPIGGVHDISHIVAPNIIRTAYQTSKVLTKAFGKVIPSKRTLFSLSSTINNLDVYTDAVPELGDYMKGTMADLNRQSMGVEFPKTPKQNDIYMSALKKFGDDTIDDALAEGKGEFGQLPESTRNFLMYVRQKRREVLSVLKGIKNYFYGEGETYTPPTNPFSVGRNQLFHVLTSDIDQLSGGGGNFGGDIARNLYMAQLTGKWSPHVAHIVSSLQNNTSYDPLWVLRIAQGIKEGPELYQAATAFNNRGPLRSMIEETPVNRDEDLSKIHKMIDDAFMKHFRNAADAVDKAVPLTDEHKQNIVNLLTGATTEQAKTTVTRMGAIARAAQKEGLTPGQGAKLLLDDMHSTEPNIQALRMHYSIAQDMLNVIGSNAPGLRATTILDHMPLGKILAPYNFQRNVNTRLTLSYVGDIGEALRRGDNFEAGQALGKLTLHNGLAAMYLGSKAIPVELSTAINVMNPQLGQQLNNNLNQFAAIAQGGKVTTNPQTGEKTPEGKFSIPHMQPSLNPMATTNFSWVSGALSAIQTVHNYARAFQPPKNDEEAQKRATTFVGAGLLLAALAGHTEFTKLFGTMAALDYYRAYQKIQAGKKDVYYRTPHFGLIFGGDVVGSDKGVPTDFKDQFAHALSSGEPWNEFMKQTQLEANEGARQNMAWFHPSEYKNIIKQQNVEDAQKIFGAEDAKLFGYKKKPIMNIDWIDKWNEYNSQPQARALDQLQKEPPPTSGKVEI